MTNFAPATRRFYEYDPDAEFYAGVGFEVGDVDNDNDDDATINRVHSVDTPMHDSWVTLNCRGFDDNPPDAGDFPSVSNRRRVPMMSEHAWNILEPIIGKACEALPVNHPFQGKYFIIHVMRTIDALDSDASEVDRATTGDQRIRRINRYAFKDDLIKGEHIFKLPTMSGGGLIVDDVFRKIVESNGLRGLCFRELPMKT